MSKITIDCDKCPTYKNKKYLIGNYQYCVFERPMDLFIVRDDINECIRIHPGDKYYKDIIDLYEADKVMDRLTNINT